MPIPKRPVAKLLASLRRPGCRSRYAENRVNDVFVAQAKDAVVAVQRIVGGVEVENDLLGRRTIHVQEDINEDALQRLRVVVDLVVAVATLPRRMLPAG